jgi:hypothetical protein
VGNNPINLWDPLGLKDYSCGETEGIIDEAGKQNLWDAYRNHSGNGKYDFKANQPGDTFNVGGHQMKADEFGNYVAGYAGYKAGGEIGYAGVRAGGILYDFTDAWADRRGRGFGNSKFDWDADSVEDIRAGKDRAINGGKSRCGCSGGGW